MADVHDDDFDPLAPPQADSALGLAADDDDLLAPPPAPGPADDDDESLGDEGDGGFSDNERIVRTWVEDGRLTKVRVSPVWFRRLTGRTTLEDCFRQAFTSANLRVGPVSVAPASGEEFPPEVAEMEFPGLPYLNRASIAAFDILFKDQERRFAEALERQAAPRPPARVSGRSKGVTVHLNQHGAAESVEFDQAWLDDAQVGSICTHVQAAAESAYAKYQPAEPEPTELDDLIQERQLIRAAYVKLMTQGVPHD